MIPEKPKVPPKIDDENKILENTTTNDSNSGTGASSNNNNNNNETEKVTIMETNTVTTNN